MFTLREKYEILAEYEATEHGVRGLVLRKWGVSESTVHSWMRRRRLAVEKVEAVLERVPCDSDLLAAYEVLQEKLALIERLEQQLADSRKEVKAAKRKARRSEAKAEAAIKVADDLGKLSELLTSMAQTQPVKKQGESS